MFRFKLVTLFFFISFLYSFQYILCFGSSKMEANILVVDTSFNTSYVSVQANSIPKEPHDYWEFQYILCFGSSLVIRCRIFQLRSVSIHPMFRFKRGYNSFGSSLFALWFQYILCFGSRILFYEIM